MPSREDADIIRRYAGLPLFEGVPASKVPHVLRCLNATLRHFDRQERVLDVDDGPRVTGYLCAGRARLVNYDGEGNTSILGDFAPGSALAVGNLFGIDAPLDGTIVAAEPCEVLMISLEGHVEAKPCCLAHVTRIRENLARITIKTNADLLGHLSVVSMRTTRDKVLAFLARQAAACESASFDIPYSRQELADILYVERSALSHQLGRLRQEGVISFRRRHFELLRMPGEAPRAPLP